jgi:hypothetical protein
MDLEDLLRQALFDRFAARGLRESAEPGELAVMPARHPAVGDVRIGRLERPEMHLCPGAAAAGFAVPVSVGELVVATFQSYDFHLDARARVDRITRDVVRFLDELLADRLLLWRSADARASAGWRECGATGERTPLVLDDREYDIFLWSGPQGRWRASTAAFARGTVADEREYNIFKAYLESFPPADRDRAARLVEEYERRTGQL